MKIPPPHKGLRPNAAESDQSDLVGFGQSPLWGLGLGLGLGLHIDWSVSQLVRQCVMVGQKKHSTYKKSETSRPIYSVAGATLP